MLFGLGGGLRIGEVRNLNTDDVKVCQLRVRGKGGTDQVTKITDEMAEARAKWMKRMPTPKADEYGTPLFVDWCGARITTGQLRKRLKLIGAAAGVDVTPHD